MAIAHDVHARFGECGRFWRLFSFRGTSCESVRLFTHYTSDIPTICALL